MSERNDDVDTNATVPSRLEVPYSISSKEQLKYKKPTISDNVSELYFKRVFPKWVPSPVYYTFEDLEVRKKLKSLINTDVVKILDKDFMYNLQNKLYESYWEAFEQRLAERRKWEKSRRRGLAIDGVQPLDDNSLEGHPITQVRRDVEKALEAIKERTRRPYQTRKRMIWEYRQFFIDKDEEEEEGQQPPKVEEVKASEDMDDLEMKIKQLGIKPAEKFNMKSLLSEKFYKRIKYEPTAIQELKAAQGVNALYEIADKILKFVPSQPLTEAMIKSELSLLAASRQDARTEPPPPPPPTT